MGAQNATTKILLYMVIHDLKHPTESLIASLKQTLQSLRFTQTQLTKAQIESNEIASQLSSMLNQRQEGLQIRDDFWGLFKNQQLSQPGADNNEEADGLGMN
jgi:hypothetical protein